MVETFLEMDSAKRALCIYWTHLRSDAIYISIGLRGGPCRFKRCLQVLPKKCLSLGQIHPTLGVFSMLKTCLWISRCLYCQANVHFTVFKRERYGKCCTSFISLRTVEWSHVVSCIFNIRWDNGCVAWQRQIITPTNAHINPLQTRHTSII